MHAQSLSCVRLFVTPRIQVHQAPLSMGVPRQEYWSRLPCPPPGDLPDPRELTQVSCIGRWMSFCNTENIYETIEPIQQIFIRHILVKILYQSLELQR